MVVAFSAQTTGQKKVEKSCLTHKRAYVMMGHMKRETGNHTEDTMKAKKNSSSIRKQSKPATFWSATLKRFVTVPE
jgi:hypothetical protein